MNDKGQPRKGFSFLAFWQQRPGVFLFFFMVVTYTLTAPGLFFASFDGMTMLAVTRHIVDGNGFLYQFPEAGKVVYSKYGLAQSLAYIPLDFLGLLVGRGNHQVRSFFDGFTQILLASSAICGVFSCLKTLGLSNKNAFLSAIAGAFTTPIWVYAGQDFSEVLQCALLIWTIAFLLKAREGTQLLPWFLVGLLAGILVLTKAILVLALPVVLLGVVGLRFLEIKKILLGGLGLIGPMALFAWYNYARFGSPFETGYGEEAKAFTEPLRAGLYGLTVYPGKGIFWFSPLLLLFPILFFNKEKFSAPLRHLTFFSLGLLVIFLLIFAKWYSWQGGFAYGPRFLVPFLPLPVACLVAVMLEKTGGKLKPGLLILLLGLGGLGAVHNLVGSAARLQTTYDHGLAEQCVRRDILGIPIKGYDKMIVRCWPPPQVTHAKNALKRVPKFIKRVKTLASGTPLAEERGVALHFWWAYAMVFSPKAFWAGLVGLILNLTALTGMILVARRVFFPGPKNLEP